MMVTPEQAIAQSDDIVLAVVTSSEGPYPVKVGDDSYTDSDVVVRLRVLASWKGARTDTLSLTTGAGGGDCGYEFIVGGVYLIYAHRDKNGGLHTSICSRTRPVRDAREDSLALGAPAIDRTGGKAWAAFGPPATCPVHRGVAISVGYARPAFGLTPEARRAYPDWVPTEYPFAGLILPRGDVQGMSGRNAYICPYCREAALIWLGNSMEASTGPERFRDLPSRPGGPALPSEAEYRKLYPRSLFAFQYRDCRNFYDSIESEYQREFGGVRDTSFKFALDDAELDRIYEVTVAARLMEIDAPHPPYPDATRGAAVRADCAALLYVRCGGDVRQFSWYGERAPSDSGPGTPWNRLNAVYHAVQKLLSERAEVRSLRRVPPEFADALRDAGR